MSQRRLVLCSIATLAFFNPVFAEPDDTQANEKHSEALPGTATSQLLSLQRSGSISSSNEQYLSGKVRAQTYKRYVDSFGRPIPQSYIDDSFTNGD